MDLDLTTLLVCCTLALLTVGTVFTATVALRHSDSANRAWAAGIAAAVCVMGLTTIYGLDSATPVAVVGVIDATCVFAVGVTWVGYRALDGRSTRLVLLIVLAAALVAAPTVLFGEPADLDMSATLRLGVSGLLAWLCAIELERGRMRMNLNSRIQQLALFVFGGWYLTSSAIIAAADGPLAQRPTLEAQVLPLTALFIVSALCQTALRVERTGNWWSMNVETTRKSNLGVLTSEQFRNDCRDRLERADLTGRRVSLVLAEIDALEELNTAFGREAGDSAMLHFTQLLRSHVPATALLGHLGAGRFGILTVMTSDDTADNIIASIRTGLLDSRLRDDMEIRIDAIFASANNGDAPASFEGLMQSATAELERSAV